ncbi:MAG TPA: bifunctional sulfate adenylyltransferase/adenylylsulfate kinase [Anaerolineales bacterium]|nr:bifunctional sulfate adenylyltransferase/adenylylsulfate kinase [Anaerolineales bacterium]
MNHSPELITPYGGQLVNLLVDPNQNEKLKEYASKLPSFQLTERQICDLEMLAIGAFSPLRGFMGEADFHSVVNTMRLKNGTLFPMPITLGFDPHPELQIGQEIALRDRKYNLLAVLRIEEIYGWDHNEVAQKVFGTTDLRHPIVTEMYRWGKLNIAGELRVLQLPVHHDFRELRHTPAETRQKLADLGQSNVVAFQTRNPLHRAHEELTKRAAESVNGTLLLHPVVGLTKPGDIDHFTRVRSYKELVANHYDPQRVLLSLLPLAMRMGGPREALWHAIIRRNYGANHFIVGRDHAGPGNDSKGQPFYGPYDAQDLVAQYASEIGVQMVPFKHMVYLPDEDRYEEIDNVPEKARIAAISGTQVRDEYLRTGKALPEWFTRPEVAKILAETFPPRHKQGLCLWFTGLSGAGKSTIAEVLVNLLFEHGRIPTVLDGDVIRTHLSKGLGFSQEDRDINIRRIGYVASEIVKHGGTVICAAISPYRATRNDVRNMIGQENYVEVFVNTPIEVCEARDVKGLYAKARRGELKGFTGIDDPYEAPEYAEINLTTHDTHPEANAQKIVQYLLTEGFVR